MAATDVVRFLAVGIIVCVCDSTRFWSLVVVASLPAKCRMRRRRARGGQNAEDPDHGLPECGGVRGQVLLGNGDSLSARRVVVVHKSRVAAHSPLL